MYKLFTPLQATEMLGVVDPMLRDLQEALHDALRLQRERSAVRPESLRARQLTTELTFVIESAQLTKAEFDRLGVFVKDLEEGVVEFPSKLGAEIVYLSWAQGEDAVTHYHALSQEAALRRPLPGNGLGAAGLQTVLQTGLQVAEA